MLSHVCCIGRFTLLASLLGLLERLMVLIFADNNLVVVLIGRSATSTVALSTPIIPTPITVTGVATGCSVR